MNKYPSSFICKNRSENMSMNKYVPKNIKLNLTVRWKVNLTT